MSFSRGLYQAGTLLASAPLLPLMLLRPRGRARIRERYGDWNLALKDCVWFHGASLGEINSLLPIMHQVRAELLSIPILATASSTTGLEKARIASDYQRLQPIDNWLWLERAASKIKPRGLIFAETELWPAFLGYLKARQVPLLLVNARISDYSYPHYQRLRWFIAPLLKDIDLILAGDQTSAERFITLGADPGRVKLAGNAKYDIRPTVTTPGEARELRRRFFADDDPVLVLGSLRPGEDELWFPVLKGAYDGGKRLNIIVAPRHQEKFEFFARRLDELGLRYRRKSRQSSEQAAEQTERVVLLDTMGELNRVYSFADVAFVGGTLVNWGGHNPLEPAMYNACVAMGPYTNNVAELVKTMEECGGCLRLRDASDLTQLVDKLARSDSTLKDIGAKGFKVWQQVSGATSRIVSFVLPYLSRGEQ